MKSLVPLLLCLTAVRSSTPRFTDFQLENLFNISRSSVSQHHLLRSKRNLISGTKKWVWDPKIQGFRVPYQIDLDFPRTIPSTAFQESNNFVLPSYIRNAASIPVKKELEKNIEKAKVIFEASTSIRLVPKENSDEDFIAISYNYRNSIRRRGECWSYIGRIGGEQEMAVGSCFYSVGSVIHQFMHALGFLHEHQRYDRDNFIQIKKKNDRSFQVNCGKETPAPGFERESVAYTDYDFYSVMHWPLRSNLCGDMKIINPELQIDTAAVGNQQELSRIDIDKINYHYVMMGARPLHYDY